MRVWSLEKVGILTCARNSRQWKCTVNNAAPFTARIGRYALQG
ncbi:hypothetical protein Taro_043140 [Colocasia esculenta]|uniref:Uncharacterized protein n=1 Tax=Colocasia esculenta TaxID=4460 RepID=A0A843WFM5_COLES|nr:hypothetical protein [Colocasia esculenta]